ncbi:MAG TPA: cytochrome c biogenesis protein CcsA [Gemmatimonadaceae bacterium]|nr:cytochrome c biogenesis protein CcsA [Gemmatimonadaceae bacterium]
MILTAHLLAILSYLGAAALAAAPFARPLSAPVRGVVALLCVGVAAHVAGLAGLAALYEQAPLTGIGPALSFAGLLIAATLMATEWLAREVSLTLVGAPLAALVAAVACVTGLVPRPEPDGVRGVWLVSHIALSFLGIAAFATAATAGAMYLAEHRELKSRRFGALFRFFPPLETLDRVNHLAAVTGWLTLSVGVALAISYTITYGAADLPKVVWALAAWLGVTALTMGRVLGGWRAQRAALVASVGFAAVVALYVAFRVAGAPAGQFL